MSNRLITLCDPCDDGATEGRKYRVAIGGNTELEVDLCESHASKVIDPLRSSNVSTVTIDGKTFAVSDEDLAPLREILQGHARNALTGRPFHRGRPGTQSICPNCHNLFPSKRHLRDHVCTAIAPFESKVAKAGAKVSGPCRHGCNDGRVYADIYSHMLNRHDEYLEGDYVCPAPGCSRSFTTAIGLNVHARKNH